MQACVPLDIDFNTATNYAYGRSTSLYDVGENGIRAGRVIALGDAIGTRQHPLAERAGRFVLMTPCALLRARRRSNRGLLRGMLVREPYHLGSG